MNKLKVSYCALGCKVNLYEAEAIMNEFLDHGYEHGEFDEVCDVYIINTCTVTSTSDSKSKKIVRQAVKRNPNAVIAVMGCSSQLLFKDYSEIDGVDIVLGTSNRHNLFNLVEEKLKNKNLSKFLSHINYDEISSYEELKVKRYNSRTRGFVKIQDGCENFCSYCTIPYSRGPIKSRESSNVIEEIQYLTNQGMKEIVLSGINTGAYGKDLKDFTFSKLLKEIVDNVKGLGRIRISSIEATEIDDELLNIIYENKEHFCMHLHIPLQGGCDKTLERMNRKYNIEYYTKKIAKIRSYFKDINITTDILAGFSGETEEDFNEAYKFIESINYGEMHVFPYSPRPLTKAYSFPDRIDEVTKKYRVNQLLSLNKVMAIKYREKFSGKVLDVLVERNINGKCFGHTSNYLEVEFIDKNAKPNDLINVKIESIGYPICKGSVSNV